MGDRGETATIISPANTGMLSLSDGRSGGNRNYYLEVLPFGASLSDGRSGGNRNVLRRLVAPEVSLSDGRSGGNRNSASEESIAWEVYPMGDRGETATRSPSRTTKKESLSDGRSGGNRNGKGEGVMMLAVYPMGDRGETATASACIAVRTEFIRWEIGGKPQQRVQPHARGPEFIRWEIGGKPQLHRGRGDGVAEFIRWEIGGKPQPSDNALFDALSLSDGRSGGNRNRRSLVELGDLSLSDGRSGGNRNECHKTTNAIMPVSESAGEGVWVSWVSRLRTGALPFAAKRRQRARAPCAIRDTGPFRGRTCLAYAVPNGLARQRARGFARNRPAEQE